MEIPFKKVRTWIVQSEIRIALIAFLFSGIILFLLTVFYNPTLTFSKAPNLGLYNNPGFWENVLIESHGMLLDILVIGVFIFWLQKKTQTSRDTQRLIDQYKNELDDHRGWLETEASYRVAGLVKRLRALGVKKFDFSDLHIGKLPIKDILAALKEGKRIASLSGAVLANQNLQEVDFSGIILKEIDLSNAKLHKATFYSTQMDGAKLDNAHLEYAYFNDANLIKADLSGAQLQGANLLNALLLETNLSDAKLIEVDFSGVNAKRANFTRANLERAIFIDADLTGANLVDTILTKAKLKNVNLQGAEVSQFWFEQIERWEIAETEHIKYNYFIEEVSSKEVWGKSRFILRRKSPGSIADTID